MRRRSDVVPFLGVFAKFKVVWCFDASCVSLDGGIDSTTRTCGVRTSLRSFSSITKNCALLSSCGVTNPALGGACLSRATGGDTSPGGEGTFYEGVVVKGFSTDAADAEVQANIVAARYGQT